MRDKRDVNRLNSYRVSLVPLVPPVSRDEKLTDSGASGK